MQVQGVSHTNPPKTVNHEDRNMKNATRMLLGMFLLAFYVTGCGIPSYPTSSGIATPSISAAGKARAGESSGNTAGSAEIPANLQPGVITAGEWNDLDHWDFWQKLLTREEFGKMPGYWDFYTQNRISVNLTDQKMKPVANAVVKLVQNGSILSTARSDKMGNAVLWAGLTRQIREVDYTRLKLTVNGTMVDAPVLPHARGINKITVSSVPLPENLLEIAFVVDATASMSDEMEYLKTELVDVINRARQARGGITIRTAAVFYRDEGDEFLTRVSNFTGEVGKTRDFVKAQKAGGGGDYPEAVHTALEKATTEWQWSDKARTRIMFLLLDAPPHHRADIKKSIHNSVALAMEKGIKVIPIVASGIDKETEFLMRFLAVGTNGTYVFVTDHSGVGEKHLEPSVGAYSVEHLNDLMVRLIKKYS